MQEFVDKCESQKWKPLYVLIKKHYNWTDYFNNINKYYEELEANDFDPFMLDYDWSQGFTLSYVIYSIRNELDCCVNEYIDEHQVVESWIRKNKIPDEFVNNVWKLYDILDKIY